MGARPMCTVHSMQEVGRLLRPRRSTPEENELSLNIRAYGRRSQELRMQNLKTRTSGHQMCPPRGAAVANSHLENVGRTGLSQRGGAPAELLDRGPRELDKRGVLMDLVRGANQSRIPR